MSRHRYSQKVLPKFQDTDTEVRYMKEGAVRYAMNGRVGRRDESTKGAWTKVKGTLYVPNQYLPAGQNKCLGAVSNKTGTFLVFFNWNSAGSHGIYLYDPKLDVPVQLLYGDTPENIVLGFHKHYLMAGTKAKIVLDRHLFWTDQYNSPRYLNIEWALDYKKKRKWEFQQIDSDITDFNILNFTFNGSPVSLFVNNLGSLLASNAKINDYFDVEVCKDAIIITEKQAGTCEISTTSPKIRIVAQNFYPKPHNERQIDLVLQPPLTAPNIVLKRDRKNKRNFLSGNTWQFRVKYVYKDGNQSVWSPWSKSINTSGECSKNYNFIEIDYTDPIFDTLNDINQLCVIDKVILGYRNRNQGELHSFVTIEQNDIPKISQTYKFYNDTYATAEPEADDIKPYDTVPLQCGALSSVNNRLLLGDGVENYEADCFDFDVEVEYNTRETPNSSGVIVCNIEIRNQENALRSLPIMQMQEESNVYYWGGTYDMDGLSHANIKDSLDLFDQRLALKGFVGYIAGTETYTISKQKDARGLRVTDLDSNIVKIVPDTSDYTRLKDVLAGENNRFTQELRFEGLPDGKYVIRLASHWCWRNEDALGKGEAYNIDNGLAYQRTSTNVYSVNGQTGVYEAEVEIRNGVQVGVPPVFTIDDTTIPSDRLTAGENQTLFQGYLIDERSSDQEDIYNGIRVEHATIGIIKLTPITENERFRLVKYTDHNGYFYGAFTANNSAPRNKLKILAAKNRGIGWGILPQLTGEGTFVWDNDTILKGNLSELSNASCSVETNNNYGILDGEVQNFILYSVRPNATNITNNYRTRIQGRVVDSTGNGLPGFMVVASQTGRVDRTDQDGYFSIILYSNYRPIFRSDSRTVTLYIFGTSCATGFTEVEYQIDLGATEYNNTTPFDVGNILLDVTDNDITGKFYLKNGGTYDFGVTLLDRANRKTTVIFNEKKHRIRLPFTTEKIQDYFQAITQDSSGNSVTADTKAEGYFTVKIKPVSEPPVWATHLLPMRTDDQVYADYVQMVVSDVMYVVNYDEITVDGVTTPTPQTTTYGAADANEIYLDLTTSFKEYKDRNSESIKGWTFEKGDRLRFLYKRDGTLHNFVEVEVKEQRGNYIVIPLVESLSEILQGEVVEIFRLKTKTTQKNFYETGEFIKILNPYKPNRSWEQADIRLNTGDAYRRNRRMYAVNDSSTITNVRLIEDMTPDDTYLAKDNDRGRLDFINTEFRQLRRRAVIRFGGNILSGSNINNIRRFDFSGQVSSDNNYGRITIIDEYGDQIFVAQERKCHTRLVSKTRAYLGDGNAVVYEASQFLSSPYYLNDDYGCINPESYTRGDNMGVFFDATMGVICRYSPQNGVMNVSGYDNQYRTTNFNEQPFKLLSRQLANIPADIYNLLFSFVSGYNDYDKEFNLTFSGISIKANDSISVFSGTGIGSNIGEDDVKFKAFDKSPITLQLNPATYVYDAESTSWLGERSYTPTAYGTMTNRYIMFLNGDLHIAEAGSKFNHFFGVQYPSILKVVMNQAPSDMKYFTAWSVESTHLWSNPYVKVYNARAFRDIESETPDSRIVQQNGVFYAAYLFDKNTPNIQNPLFNGNKLSGEALLMELRNESDENVLLFAINMYAGYIGRTNF